MNKEELEFEKYFRQKLISEHEIIKNLPYTEEQLREIYRGNWEWERKVPDLELSIEPQQLDYDTVQYFLPEKWEMPRKGRLLYCDEDLKRVLKLLLFNLGVRESLDVIPHKLIVQYIENNNKQSLQEE
ncbi:hypothetical protein HPT25_14425 [Bacillus sp. BRMEA1]|uniref:hypothetical protein n=1 Tax=Neobacillus endophyticus TaxID=2738405 RepID=UPI001563810A|nr:hypothetical protein [Neobacillus endophyticus]NRD78556.1 hypothetical protein [Neobacillus endophyticus]